MATTPRELIEAAYPKSTRNMPGSIASEASELLKVLTRILHGLFAAGTRVNLTFFGTVDTVVKNAVGWARPSTAESVWLLTKDDGSRVHIVPFDDQGLMGSDPAVFRFGATYREAAASLQGVTDLMVYFSSRCETPADLDTAIDSRWPEQFNELVVLLLSYYLAVKDGRAEEYAGLEAQVEHWFSLYLAFLEHETVGEVRRYDPVRFGVTEGLVPLMQILGLVKPGRSKEGGR